MTDAIRCGYSCDYSVYVPMIQKNEAITDIPEMLASGDQTLTAKALFLVNGMLVHGCRRCIAYMVNKQECDAFLPILKKVVETYHGCEFWGGKIDCDVGRTERESLLSDFQAGDNVGLRVLTSVRILDEAIDIVRCDSQFVSHVGENASDIRTVQRLCRGMRIDRQNPAKINHMFMWTDEWSDALNALSLLRTMDIAFHTKVGVSPVEYEANSNKTKRELNVSKTGKLSDYVSVTCLTLDELFDRKVELFKRFYEINKRVPTRLEKFEDKKIGIMLNTFRTKRHTMSDERREALNTAMPGWSNVDEALSAGIKASLSEADKIALFKRFYEINKRVPTRLEKFEDKKIGIMLNTFRKKRHTMSDERRVALNAAMPGWFNVDEAKSAGMKAALSEEEKIALFKRFYELHKRVPKQLETFEDKKIGIMLNTFRSNRDSMSDKRRAALDDVMPGWR